MSLYTGLLRTCCRLQLDLFGEVQRPEKLGPEDEVVLVVLRMRARHVAHLHVVHARDDGLARPARKLTKKKSKKSAPQYIYYIKSLYMLYYRTFENFLMGCLGAVVPVL